MIWVSVIYSPDATAKQVNLLRHSIRLQIGSCALYGKKRCSCFTAMYVAEMQA